MRLIDADEMWANGFKNNTVSFEYSFPNRSFDMELKLLFRDAQRFIDNQPTIQAVPIDVLDKIQTEIETEKIGYPPNADEYKTINRVLQIIDKYRREQE